MQKGRAGTLNVRTNILAGKITVYGKDACIWTQKQKDYFAEKNIPYTYVDCSKQTCPFFVNGYPTLVVDGKIINGFTEV